MKSRIRSALLILAIALVSTVPALATLPSGNGQTTAAKSLSVVFASDAAAITATVSGGATAALQTIGNTSLANIPTKGSTTMVNSMPVTLATNDTVAATLATSAKQDTAQTSLTTIAASAAGSKTAGQATMANSVPVTLASNQSTIGVTPAVSASVDPGQNLSLGDTAAHAFASATGTIGIMVSAPLGNTAAIYCALGSGVTSGNTGKGIELQPGDREIFPVANASTVNCITATATQNVHAVAF